jgi:hypothetical protein
VSRVLGFDSDYHLRVHLRPLHISQESGGVVQAGWHAARHLDSARGDVLWEPGLSWEIEISGKEC